MQCNALLIMTNGFALYSCSAEAVGCLVHQQLLVGSTMGQ